MRASGRLLAILPLALLPAVMAAQRPSSPLLLRRPDAHREWVAAPQERTPASTASGRAALAPWAVRSGVAIADVRSGHRHVFVVGGAIAGAAVSGLLIARGKGLAPCSTGGTPAFCATARVLVVGAGAGVGALLGYLASHAFP